jgi:site-specific DNA-methyltransferase (adenine-specific)
MQHKSEYLDLRLCDNMQLMAQYPDKHFELAICDPPYGINAASMNMGLGNSAKCSKKKNRQWVAKKWDSDAPDKSYFDELFRVSQNQIIWGGNYFDLGACKKFIIWDKETPNGMSFSDCEYAYTSFKGANKIFRYSAYLDKNSKFHPTQKPVALYKWLLDKYAKAGDKILDTHLGSGSIAIACHDYKYHLTACELDSDYFAAMQTRVENHLKQTTILF